MSKAVFVMDMPERCSECQLLLQIPQKNGLALCLGRCDNGHRGDQTGARYDWCLKRKLRIRKKKGKAGQTVGMPA